MRQTLMAAALLLAASPAFAAVTLVIVPSAPGIQGSGAGFEDELTGTLTQPYTESGLTFTTNGIGVVEVRSDTLGGIGAFPAGNNSTQYLNIRGGSFVDVAASGLSSKLSFYWGSVDDYNLITFYNAANNPIASLTGSDLSPLIADGNQQSDLSNRFVTISLQGGQFAYARLSSSSNSFEIDNISAGVPEPSTWAMMLIGFAGLAFASRRKDRRIALAA